MGWSTGGGSSGSGGSGGSGGSVAPGLAQYAKSKSSGGGGILGTGFGPDVGPDIVPDRLIEHTWNAATFIPKSLAGLSTGTASALIHGGTALGDVASAGVANLQGKDPSQYWKDENKNTVQAGQFAVAPVQQFSQGLSNLADIPAIIPGVQGYGQVVNRATGLGLAEIGAAASDKPISHDVISHTAQALAPPSLAESAKQPGGYLNPLINTIGALATIGGAAVKGGDFAQGVAGDAHPGLSAAGQTVSDAGAALKHPLSGTWSSTIGQLGNAAKRARTADDLSLNPEARAYYDAAGKNLGMRPPNAVVNNDATNSVVTGAPQAAEYQAHPVNPADLTPADQAAAAKAYGTNEGAKNGLIPETKTQFSHLTNPQDQGGMGVQVEYVDRENNPYVQADGSTNHAAMLKDIRENKHLYVDKTSPDEAHPYMTAEQNDKFRAVHDAFGHSLAGNDFGANGEEVAFQHHAPMYSPEAQQALAMETRGQNSTLNYSPENLARAAAGESKQFDVQRAGIMPKDMSTPGYTHELSPTEEMSPTARAEQVRSTTGPAPWAENAISHLNPQGITNRLLSTVESAHQGHALSVIDREQARSVEAQMNVADKTEPFIKAMKGATDALRADHPEVKPATASAMLGDELRSRLTAATLPDRVAAAKAGGAPQRIIDRLEQVGHQTKSMLPKEMLTPAVDKAVEDLRSKYGEFQAKTREGYAASSTLADRGLSDMGPKDENGQPRWTKQQQVLQQRIDKLESVSAKARTREQSAEVTRLTKQRDVLQASHDQLQTDINTSADKRVAAGEQLAADRAHVAPPEEKPVAPGKPLTKVVDAKGAPIEVYHGGKGFEGTFDMGSKNYPGEGKAIYFSGDKKVAATYGENVRPQYLDLQNPAYESFPRSGVSQTEIDYLKSQGHDGLIMDDPARPGNKEYMVFDTSSIHDTPETLPREASMPNPQSAAQMVRSTPAAPNPQLPVRAASLANHEDNLAAATEARGVSGIGYTKDQALEAEQNAARQGIEADKNVLANASKQETPNSALQRGVNLAYTTRDIADATARITDRQKASDALQKQIDGITKKIEGTDLTDAEKKAQRADVIRIKTQMRLTKSLEDAPPSQWQREYRPAGLELEKLAEEAKTDPELRQWIAGAEPIFRTFVSRLAANGFDPQYVRDFTPTQVGKMMKDTVELSPGKIEIAGARKNWTGALQRAQNGSLDTSLESYVAAMHEMHREIARNIAVDYFQKNYAVPISVGTTFDPKHWAAWDPAKSFLQQGREGENLVASKGTQYVIPRSLDLALRAAEQDYTTKLGGWMSKFTNPWRTAVITASPAFYLQHVISHAVLASIEGVGLHDWANAWQEYRARGNGNIYDMLQGHSMAREVGGSVTMTPAQGMRDRMRQELLSAKADGRGLIGTARAGGSGAIHGFASTLHNFTNVTDAISRTAVYMHDMNKPGFNESDALNRAYASVVDYGDLNPIERNLVRQVVPFYSFQKQILKIALKMPVDHPIVMALAASLARVNQEQQKDAWGQALTDGYNGIIPIGGGAGLDTRKINPFKDSTSLVTSDGIASSLHPLLGELFRYIFHAPSGGYVQQRTVDPYGNEVPQLTEQQVMRDLVGGIPGVQEATALAGGGSKGPLQQTAAFLGANVRTKDQMQKLADRIAGARAAAASNSPYAQKARAGSSSSTKGGWSK